ncbi:MAG: hypothetical protein J6M18_02775 [Actinomycetaceae bacterium]|nr:hypothetical protein [Actinomycetaceae bacterium]
MSQVAQETVRIIVFSDDSTRRRQVMDALGRRVGEDGPLIEYREIATAPMAMLEIQGDTRYDLAILDGETRGLSGLGLGKMMHDEVPSDHINADIPTINLIARPQDEWLSRWSGAHVALPFPVEPASLIQAVEKALEKKVQA